jgi:cell wall-associated NlpC family hydrolase
MDMKTQLEYMWLEMNGRDSTGTSILNKKYGGMEGLKSSTDYKKSTMAFEDSFERAGKPMYENRYKYAGDILNSFKNSGGDAGTIGTSGGGTGVVKTAMSFIGKLKYVFGGTNITAGGSGDCSAFTQQVFKKNNITIGRTANAQMIGVGSQINMSSIQPGDLVFFQGTYNTSGASHVGIAIGNGQMVHLASKGCRIDDYTTGYWGSHYLSARRISGASSNSSASTANVKTEDTSKVTNNTERDSWFTDVFNRETGPLAGSSSNSSPYEGASSSYKANSFSNLGQATGSGISSLIGGLNVSGLGNAYNSVLGNSNASSLLPSFSNPYGYNNNATITNKQSTQLINNMENVGRMQSIMQQIEENGKQGNDTLVKMLEVLTEIRESAKATGIVTVPINTNSNNSHSTNTSTRSSLSQEMESILTGY